jgi:integrase
MAGPMMPKQRKRITDHTPLDSPTDPSLCHVDHRNRAMNRIFKTRRRLDLTLPQVPDRDRTSDLIRGKANKARRCPLGAQTVRELSSLLQGRAAGEHVFLNRSGRRITRFGIHAVVECCVARAAKDLPSLTAKRFSPHMIRHTTATHLVRGRGHQHDPGVAGARVAGDDQRVCGGGSGAAGVGKL